jgi:hypothetical protein
MWRASAALPPHNPRHRDGWSGSARPTSCQPPARLPPFTAASGQATTSTPPTGGSRSWWTIAGLSPTDGHCATWWTSRPGFEPGCVIRPSSLHSSYITAVGFRRQGCGYEQEAGSCAARCQAAGGGAAAQNEPQTPNWRPWFVNSSRCALIRRIRLRGATSRYRATWSRRDSPTRCANEGVATTRQGHGLVDPNGTAHALARTRHWRWYSYLPPCPIILLGPYLSFGKSDVIHGTILAFAQWPSDGPRLADLGRGGPRAEGAKRSLPQTNFLE